MVEEYLKDGEVADVADATLKNELRSSTNAIMKQQLNKVFLNYYSFIIILRKFFHVPQRSQYLR